VHNTGRTIDWKWHASDQDEVKDEFQFRVKHNNLQCYGKFLFNFKLLRSDRALIVALASALSTRRLVWLLSFICVLVVCGSQSVSEAPARGLVVSASASVLVGARVRLSAGSYQDLINWYCSLLTRRTVCGRAAGNTPRSQTQTEWHESRNWTNSVLALQDHCCYKAPTTNHHIIQTSKWMASYRSVYTSV